ncbi:MAG: ABC transporter permease [Spirochaetia bacterium]
MRSKHYGLLYTSFGGVFLALFFVIPLLIILCFSLMKADINAGVLPQFSLDAYRTLFRPDYGRALMDTIFITAIATTIAIAVAVPCAYYMAVSRHQTFLLFLIIIPFWTNFLVRIFSWKAILEANGFLNLILLKLGIVDIPIIFLYNRVAVIIVLAYTYLPFAILPLYSTIEKFDFSLLEAGRDLGCRHIEGLFKILLPNIKTGIMTAFVFVMIPIFGQYVIPELIGGGREGTFMLGQKIASSFFRERNWPVPAAFSTLLIGLMLIALVVSMNKHRFLKKKKRILASNIAGLTDVAQDNDRG